MILKKTTFFLGILFIMNCSSNLGTNQESVSNEAESIKKKGFIEAAIVGPQEVVSGQENIWYANISGGVTISSYEWYYSNEFIPYWEPISGSNSWDHEGTYYSDPPNYNIDYELRVVITLDNDDTYEATHSFEVYYDPGWDDCENVGGPGCDSQF